MKSLSAKLRPGLVKYRVEFGTKSGDREAVLHRAGNPVCGDAYLINGQSNAVATDFGKDDPAFRSEWIRLKSCAMGVNGSDNRLREVQRTLPGDWMCQRPSS